METKTQLNLIVTALVLFIFTSINTLAQESTEWMNWTKSNDNPIVYPANKWFDVARNPIVIHEDGKFKMWFTGYRNYHWLRQIGYAESFDGLNWQFYEEPVITSGSSDPLQKNKLLGNVLRVNDTLRMWYGGFNDDFDKYATYYAWSVEDGIWNLHPQPVLEKGEQGQWDEDGAYGWPVYFDGLTYHMLYSNILDLGYATSTDGIIWEKDYENNPVFVRGPDGCWYDEWVMPGPVIVRNNTIHMFFSASDGGAGSTCDGFFRTGHAWTQDFVNWTIRNDDEYVLDRGDSGDWDYLAAWTSCIIYHDNQYKLWYSGNNQGWAMGSAGLVTDIGEAIRSDRKPLLFSPNPFIQEARLNYTVTDNTHVKLGIYKLNGQHLILLVDEIKQRGNYDVLFNGAELPVGVYLCILETDSGMQSIKVVKME